MDAIHASRSSGVKAHMNLQFSSKYSEIFCVVRVFLLHSWHIRKKACKLSICTAEIAFKEVTDRDGKRTHLLRVSGPVTIVRLDAETHVRSRGFFQGANRIDQRLLGQLECACKRGQIQQTEPGPRHSRWVVWCVWRADRACRAKLRQIPVGFSRSFAFGVFSK